MSLWRNRSISQRILAIVGILALAVLLVVGIATLRLTQVGNEMTEITEEHLPLTHDLRKATEHQLLQALRVCPKSFTGAPIAGA